MSALLKRRVSKRELWEQESREQLSLFREELQELATLALKKGLLALSLIAFIFYAGLRFGIAVLFGNNEGVRLRRWVSPQSPPEEVELNHWSVSNHWLNR